MPRSEVAGVLRPARAAVLPPRLAIHVPVLMAFVALLDNAYTVSVSSASHLVRRVLGVRTRTQVRRVSAWGIVAGVQDDLPIREDASMEQEGVHMRAYHPGTVPEGAVSVLRRARIPAPTSVTTDDLGPEPLANCFPHGDKLHREVSG